HQQQQQQFQPSQMQVQPPPLTVAPAPLYATGPPLMMSPTGQMQPPPLQLHLQPQPQLQLHQPAAAAGPGLVTNYKCVQCGSVLASAKAPCRRLNCGASRTSAHLIQTMTGNIGNGSAHHGSGTINSVTTLTSVGPPVLLASGQGPMAVAHQHPPIQVMQQHQQLHQHQQATPLQPILPIQQQPAPQVVYVTTTGQVPSPENNYGTDATYYRSRFFRDHARLCSSSKGRSMSCTNITSSSSIVDTTIMGIIRFTKATTIITITITMEERLMLGEETVEEEEEEEMTAVAVEISSLQTLGSSNKI
ncbi:hypothetical protein BGZ98_006168, partial [Dissophora globulifera]